jgi:hypothetical protein
VRFCIAFVLAALPVLVAAVQPGLANVPVWSMFCAGLCLLTVFFTPGEPLYGDLGLSDNALLVMRESWLGLGTLLLVCAANNVALAWITPVLMLMLLGGVLIARYNTGKREVWFSMCLLTPLVLATLLSTTGAQHLLAPVVVILAYFTISRLVIKKW